MRPPFKPQGAEPAAVPRNTAIACDNIGNPEADEA